MTTYYIPVIIIAVLLITGVASYTVSQKNNQKPEAPKEQIEEASDSAQIGPSSTPTLKPPSLSKPKQSLAPKPISSPSPKITPLATPQLTPTPTQPVISTFNVTLTPTPESQTTNASGQVSLELYKIDPYMGSLKIASFRLNGNVSNLKPDTNYTLALSPVPGGWVGILNFTTDSSGSAALKVPKDSNSSGVGVNYDPSNPLSNLEVYEQSQSKPSLKGSFTMSAN